MTGALGRARDRTVLIDCYFDTLAQYPGDPGIIGVDVIRSTTTAATAVARGWRCLPVPDLDRASDLAARGDHLLLVGELGGNMPFGFHLTNSPVEVERHPDAGRTMVLLSSSGTRLLWHANAAHSVVHAASLRNWRAQATQAIAADTSVVLLGAGTRGEFREEDQLCCAWIARLLIDAGFTPLAGTRGIVERWSNSDVDDIAAGKSAAYLRATGQEGDLDFVLSHVDDLTGVYRMCPSPDGPELKEVALPRTLPAAF